MIQFKKRESVLPLNFWLYLLIVFHINLSVMIMDKKQLTEEQVKIIKRLIEKGMLTENQIKRLKKQGVI